MQIKGEILFLRCATCNKVQEPTSTSAIRLFARVHWFHSGYAVLVDVIEPSELLGFAIDIQPKECI